MTPTHSTRLKSVLIVLSVLLITGAVMAVGGELAMRSYERNRPGVPGTFPLLYYRSSRFGYALIRGNDYFGWVHVDREGFRGPEVSVAKKPGTYRILAVGASTTFDVCAGRDADTWPARLQHWLDTLAPSKRFEVINAGVPGYLVLDDILRLQSELYAYAPDAIILYAAHNNLARSLDAASRGGQRLGKMPSAVPSIWPWTDWLERNSLLYNKIAIRLKAVTSFRHYKQVRETTGFSAAQWDSVLTVASTDFRRDVTSFVLIARSMGIKVIIPEVVQMAGEGPTNQLDAAAKAAWAGSSVPAPLDVIIDGYRRFNTVHRVVADSLGATFIPTKNFGLTGPAYYCGGRDPVHFNAAGSDRMAQHLAAALLDQKGAHDAAIAGR